MLLFDFTHHNIEMACSLLETCGRYLYRTADSHQRVKVYLVSYQFLYVSCHISNSVADISVLFLIYFSSV